MLVGLNPYGLCCSFGFLGKGTERGVEIPLSIDGFFQIAAEAGARSLEMDFRLLDGVDLQALSGRIKAKGMVPVLAAGMPGDHLERAIWMALALDCKVIRLHMTTVLCGDRAARTDWDEMLARSRANLKRWAAVAAPHGISLVIEDHQDLGSDELLEYCEEAGPNVGICLDTGNPLAVGEDILPFARRVASKVKHVHLKDYRVQFTEEGYRLVSCPIGDGCVPFADIAPLVPENVTAGLEPGALEARHVRLFTEGWWKGYPPRDARELAGALRTAQNNRLSECAEYQTPWERHASGAEVVAHERMVLEKSIANMKSMGWL